MHENLRDMIRMQSGKGKSPSLGLIDSRSVKNARNGSETCAIDDRKKTKGMKQHIITDTLGLILVVVIHAANKFTVLPKRCILERTFSWFESFRKLSKDYEVLPKTSQNMIYLTKIQIMLNKIK